MKVAPLLDRLADGTRVAVMAMNGSFCPVTRAHAMCSVKARDIILGTPGVNRPTHLENFGEALGYWSLSPDDELVEKMRRKGDLLNHSYGNFMLHGRVPF